MAVAIYGFDEGGNQLFPADPNSSLNKSWVANFGPNLTVSRGQALGRKTSDGKMYLLNTAASDGTQLFAGFSMYSLSTDGSGNTYLNVASGTSDYFTTEYPVGTIWSGGIFNPDQLYTQPLTSTTAAAEVDTITPTNPTTGDIYTVSTPSGVEASFTVGGTQTAAAVVTGLTNAWNADPVLKALATPSGSGTFILTGVTPGQSLNLKASAVGTGTTALVITTPASTGVVAEVDTFTPTNPTTADVNTITVTYPNLQTVTATFTVGATQTATAWTTLAKAAWNANPTLQAYAVASGTTTFILTGANVGQALSVTVVPVGTGTVAKVVTTPAFGRNIADILPGAPGSKILQPTGFWQVV